MKLNGIKKIGFLAVAMVIAFGITAVAVCPPGSTPATDPAAMAALTDFPAAGTTYCIQGSGALTGVVDLDTDNVTIVGLHPAVQVTPGAGVAPAQAFNITGNNVTIKDLTIVGVGATPGTDNFAVGIASNNDSTTIQNVTMVDGGAPGFATAAIEITGGNNSSIVNSSIESQGDGINVSGGNAHTIQNNTVATVGAVATFSPITCNGGTAHVVRNNIVNSAIDNTTGNHMINSTVTGATIEGNTITHTAGILSFGIGTTGANTVIRSNQINFTGVALSDGINVTGANTVVEGNTVVMGGNGRYGLGIDAANVIARNNTITNPQTHSVNLFTGSSNVLVEGNTLNSAGVTGVEVASGNNRILSNNINAPGGAGIRLQLGATNNTVDGNSINSAGTDGILFAAAATNNTVSNNTITGSQGANAGANGGIAFAAAATNNTFQNNTISGGNAYGLFMGPGGTAALNNRILNNTVTDNQMAGIYVTGGATNTLVDGNTVRNNGSDIFGFGEQIAVDGASNNSTITDNVCTSNRVLTVENRGIRVGGANNVTVENNTVENTSGTLDIGLFVDNGAVSTEISGNTIRNMLDFGVVVLGGSTTLGVVEFTGNTLEGNVTGVEFRGGASEWSACNVISGGAVALQVKANANADNHDITGCSVTSPIRARNDGLGTLLATANWWGASAGPPAGTVFGSVNTSGFLTSDPCDGVTPPPGKSHTYGAAFGWYMVSVPLNSGTPSALFGTVAYRWNCATGVYDLVSVIEPKFGYWVTLPANKSVTDSGSQVTTDVTVNIGTVGWYQVSAPWNIAKSALKVIKGTVEKSWADAVADGWVRDTIYAYKATDGDYTMPTTINPWYGVWMKALVSGLTLKLPVAAGTPVGAAAPPMGPKALVVPADLPPMPPSPSVGADDLEFGNYPNPIVDVHTTTFAVKGAAAYLVEAIKVQIFDLAGRLVYEAEEAGASLDWHTDSDYGEYLANGVYLYKLYALVNGEWVVSDVRKLAILR